MQSEVNEHGPAWWLRTILIGRRPKWTLVRIVVLVVTCFVVFRFILLPIRIEGPSMLPTYRDRSVNFVNRLAYLRHGPQRGDVVAIRLAGLSVMYMKRVVGLPGEIVEFSGGRLVINGQVLDEPYVKSQCRWEMQPRKLGLGEYFVVGDNRAMHIEDHYYGVPARDHIVGKVLL